MNVTVHEKANSKVAVVHAEGVLLNEVGDALDMMAAVRHGHDCDKMVVNRANIAEAFFDLRTGIAGEILQKYTNYRMKPAVVGDFSGYGSKALRDLIYESNNRNQVFFLPDKRPPSKGSTIQTEGA
ncbi:MAG: DUF4180 domain-containing protein [Christensenellales bacterium]